MSEVKEKYTLEEFVFRDIRIIDKPRANSYKDVVKNALESENNPVAKVLEYQRIMKEVYDQRKPDAERWDIALDSYMEYPCFESNERDEFLIKNSYLRYKNKQKNKEIIISADTLTGPSMIIDPAEALGLKDHEAIIKFCSVAYTVGNCCPVMGNFNSGSDTCWNKLARYHDTRNEPKLLGIMKEEWDPVVNNRTIGHIFAVFPEDLPGREIVDRLMLKDYYDENYNLNIIQDPKSCKDEEELIEVARKATSLIIKRGIRIYCGNDLKSIGLDAEGALDKLAEELIQAL